MSNVTLSIGGRQYTVACASGEERHVETLGLAIDGKLQGLASVSGQSEARTLLFAALLLADELHELRSGAAPNGPVADNRAAVALESVAVRLEGMADRLENAG